MLWICIVFFFSYFGFVCVLPCIDSYYSQGYFSGGANNSMEFGHQNFEAQIVFFIYLYNARKNILITWVEYHFGICSWVVLFGVGTLMDLGSTLKVAKVIRVRRTLRWWHTRRKMHGGKKKECSMAICTAYTWTTWLLRQPRIDC